MSTKYLPDLSDSELFVLWASLSKGSDVASLDTIIKFARAVEHGVAAHCARMAELEASNDRIQSTIANFDNPDSSDVDPRLLEKARAHLATQASPAPVPDEQAGEPVGIVMQRSIAGYPMPNTSGVEWLRPVPDGAKLYTRPVAAEKREPHTSEQRARPDRFVPSPDGRSIDDDDFIYDATLKVTGDFADDATRHSYARWICDRLNAGGTHPSTGEDA